MENAFREQPLLLSATSSSSESEGEGLESLRSTVVADEPPPTWSAGNNNGKKRLLSKQLSMRETTREAAWEKRRRQILLRRRMMMMADDDDDNDEVEEEEEDESGGGGGKKRAGGSGGDVTTVMGRSLTDEDLDELRGSIELGFGFSEEDGGHDLCHTLPALDLYFAVNRQLSDPRLRFSSPSPVSTPTTAGGGSSSSLVGTPSPRSPNHQQTTAAADSSWKICSPGDNPQHVKTRLRHWAQAVACSVMIKGRNGGASAASAGREVVRN